jgi:hypothetical protein
MYNMYRMYRMNPWIASTLLIILSVATVGFGGAQVWDVDRLIRARNPGAVFSTTDRPTTTWQTLRSITYNPLLEEGSVGSPSIQEASLVRRSRVRPTAVASGGTRLTGFLNSGLIMVMLFSGLCFI